MRGTGDPTAEVPPEIAALAERRQRARADRDFAAADELRAELVSRGWLVTDVPAGYALAPAPPYPVVAGLSDLPDHSGEPSARRVCVALLVEGWPDDLRRCVESLIAFAPSDAAIIGLDVGNIDGAGDALHALASAYPGRVRDWHVAGQAGWGPARNALLRLDTADVHVVMETSTVLTGDAISLLLAEFADPAVVGAGWRGVAVDDDWRAFHEAGPGQVEALLGYLFGVRRRAALAVGGFAAKARFYRNADLEFCLELRGSGAGQLVVPRVDLPVTQTRHRGYHDSDPAYRDRESRRNYDRILARFRGRDDLRVR